MSAEPTLQVDLFAPSLVEATTRRLRDEILSGFRGMTRHPQLERFVYPAIAVGEIDDESVDGSGQRHSGLRAERQCTSGL